MNKLEKDFCERNEGKILDLAGKFLNIKKEDLKSLGGGFANFIYAYEKDAKDYVLRFTLSSYRSVKMVEAELDWIKYLYDNGVPVPKPISFGKDSFVGQFEIEDQVISVVSFEKLEGKMGVQVKWSMELIQKWGQIMGRIHSLSKTHIPKDELTKRREWDEDELIKQEDQYIPNYETIVIKKLKDIKNTLNQLPKDKNSYGIIHGDFTPINFMVDNYDNIFVFDFDDCEYNWYAMDIAKALYYAMWRKPENRAVKDNIGYSKYFLENFMTGYLKENTLDAFWLKQVPVFLKFYEIYMYKLTHRQFDIYNLRPELVEYFRKYKYNIENDIPYIESAFFPWE